MAIMVGATGVLAADPTPTEEPDTTWTWWHIVGGEWRAWERDGTEPADEGVERTAPDINGELVTHVQRDPGPGLLVDPEGDAAGASDPDQLRIADIAFVEAYPSRSVPGALRVALEIVGPAPADDRYLTYGWVLDIDGDDEGEYGLAVDAATGEAWLTDLSTDERVTDTVIEASAYEDVAWATVPRALLGDAELSDIRVRGQVLLGRGDDVLAYDFAPEDGWLSPVWAGGDLGAAQLPPRAVASADPTSVAPWTWWHIVRGRWRSLERPGPEPSDGVERTARGADGRRVSHVVRDPGPGLAVDPVGDASDSPRTGDLRVADLTFVEARAAGTRALTLTSGIVGPDPNRGGDRLIWSWQIDTDRDGEADHSVWVGTGGAYGHYDHATDTSRPDEGLPIARTIDPRVARVTIPLALVGDPDIGDVRVRGSVSLCHHREDRDPVCALDVGPDEGWIEPSGTDADPDLAADAAPVYRALAAGLDRVWDRHLEWTEDGTYTADAYDHVEVYIRETMYGLMPFTTIPEVAALIDGLVSLDEAGRNLESHESDDLAFIVPWAMAQEIGPLADAVRARLGLRPRADDQVI